MNAINSSDNDSFDGGADRTYYYKNVLKEIHEHNEFTFLPYLGTHLFTKMIKPHAHLLKFFQGL